MLIKVRKWPFFIHYNYSSSYDLLHLGSAYHYLCQQKEMSKNNSSNRIIIVTQANN